MESIPHIERFIRRTHIAYFSMEIALRPEMPTYAGGLGILAGDTVRSCADLELPVVFVTLVSTAGYLKQEIAPDGRQIEHPDPWDPAQWTRPLGAKIAVAIEGREVWVRPWLYLHQSAISYVVPVILLDTDVNENAPEDRDITRTLYGDDEIYRLKQEIILGIGGLRILQGLGFDIHTYHLNEGHAALLALDILRRYRRDDEAVVPGECVYDISLVRERCIFTTHTPVEAGQDKFDYGLVARLFGDFMELDQIKLLAGADRLNMTRLAFNLSGYVNGVAERHAETTRRMFPGYRIHAITNGVHASTWAAPSFARLFEAHFPHWAHEPEILVRADQLSDEEVWGAHEDAKRALAAKIGEHTDVGWSPDLPTLGFARRMTGYKRPDLLFSDLDRLVALHRRHPFQIVIAGKAHPRDAGGKEIIREIHDHIARLAGTVPIVFLPNYDMALARYLVSGCDVWLNTPLPPLEASGTSGMKAALNGVLNLSVLDGWWIEACVEGVTGWAIGDGTAAERGAVDAADLYGKLEELVLPLYYGDRARWTWMMKEAVSKIAYYFNSQRMMRRYATEAYLR